MSGGPYVQAAAVCEKALQEASGVVSLIRVIDRVFFGLDAHGEPLQRQHPVTFVIMLKAGSARGSYTIQLERQSPSTERMQLLTAPVLFEGDERGISLILEAAFEPDEAGLYWFDVQLNDPAAEDYGPQLLTRIPLRAVFQQLPTAGPGGG